MNPFRVFAAALALAFATAGFAQDKPSDGAIKGGSILPGETGGMPDKGASKDMERATLEKRCAELKGTLREDCLKQASDSQRKLPEPADSAAGSSSSPR